MLKEGKYVSTNPVHDDIVYGRQALTKGEPWITPEAFKFLKSILQPNWTVFEWGSGGSTIYFAGIENVQWVVSVEHHDKWLHEIGAKLEARGLRHNVTQLYVKGAPKGTPDRFRQYADAINIYNDQLFDMVYVDGEASSRGWCITNALPRIRPGGWLMVDNSDWVKRDLGWPRWDFVQKDLKWIGHKGTFNWWTSLWRKPGAYSSAKNKTAV